MEKDWVQLCSCGSLQEAQIIKLTLTEHEIPSVLLNKQDSSYLFGEHEVFVSRENIHEAKEIINKSKLHSF
jgi:hypothetical protein